MSRLDPFSIARSNPGALEVAGEHALRRQSLRNLALEQQRRTVELEDADTTRTKNAELTKLWQQAMSSAGGDIVEASGLFARSTAGIDAGISQQAAQSYEAGKLRKQQQAEADKARELTETTRLTELRNKRLGSLIGMPAEQRAQLYERARPDIAAALQVDPSALAPDYAGFEAEGIPALQMAIGQARPAPSAPPALIQELEALFPGFSKMDGEQRLEALATYVAAKQPASSTVDPSLQAKEIYDPAGGPGSVLANFNPRTGKYTNPDTGAVIPNARPFQAPKDTSAADDRKQARIDRRTDSIRADFDKSPTVKTYNVMSNALYFVRSVPDANKNPAYDQALIYAFAKVMDPDSVVREGEYATVQKYAQSWLQNYGFNVQRVLANTEFLTPEARQNMKKVIEARALPIEKQYKNLRREYAKQIDRITGETDGESYLPRHEAAFEDEDPLAGGLVIKGGALEALIKAQQKGKP